MYRFYIFLDAKICIYRKNHYIPSLFIFLYLLYVRNSYHRTPKAICRNSRPESTYYFLRYEEGTRREKMTTRNESRDTLSYRRCIS